MIKYNKLNIEEDYLYIDVQVEDKSYFSDVTIQGVRIDTPDTYGTSTPYHEVTQEETTNLILEVYLPQAKNELLFITPILLGNPSPETPCGQDVNKVGVVYNRKFLAKKGLNYLTRLGDSCTLPKDFIDFILRQKALDLAIETCNYLDAIKYWKMLNKTYTNETNTSKCGCYGLN